MKKDTRKKILKFIYDKKRIPIVEFILTKKYTVRITIADFIMYYRAIIKN